MAFHQINGVRIRTSCVFPPIPVRTFDWCATDDDTYDGEGSPIGYGATEEDAIEDLLEQLQDDEHGAADIGADIMKQFDEAIEAIKKWVEAT